MADAGISMNVQAGDSTSQHFGAKLRELFMKTLSSANNESNDNRYLQKLQLK